MFPGCPEYCNVEGTLSEYSRNITFKEPRFNLKTINLLYRCLEHLSAINYWIKTQKLLNLLHFLKEL